jgi:8-oxo-dGTP pyrophosphatase MutT (NUDIX family)
MRVYHQDAYLDLLLRSPQDRAVKVMAPQQFQAVAHLTQSLHINIQSGQIVLYFDADSDRQGFFAHYCQPMRYVKAAGGVVRPIGERDQTAGSAQTILMIQRRKMWDLPKGKVETGESMAEAAVREVSEETGLAEIDLGEFLCTTYHLYAEKSHWYIKQTDWYNMYADTQQALIPQAAEEITAAQWVALTPNHVENSLATYASIRQVLLTALRTDEQVSE